MNNTTTLTETGASPKSFNRVGINPSNLNSMKKTITLALCLTCFLCFSSFAKIWRVNNTGIPADFTSIQQAHDSSIVAAGDTLHI